MAVAPKRSRRQRQASTSSSAGQDSDFSPLSSSSLSSSSPPPSKAVKKARCTSAASLSKFSQIFDPPSTTPPGTAPLPARSHTSSYHRPLLLLASHESGISSLLSWFSRVCSKREMPWRSAFIDPCNFSSAEELREALESRAYQVWISEIMLQQTRVETVKSFWLSWMSKWPTIHSLASACPEEVVSAWRGLGYYSRATRIHTAAKKVVSDPDMNGLLPSHPADLEKNIPGVGPYTAGAISSIVFGQPVPILDGNVARVLSRQLALYANPKSKVTTDLLWTAAHVLVKKAFQLRGGKGQTAGEWNQALMELGSTICTPQKPRCADCPIRASCRAYAEAEASVKSEKHEVALMDLEDLCSICKPLPFQEEACQEEACQEEEEKQRVAVKKMGQATLSFASSPSASKAKAKPDEDRQRLQGTIDKHIRNFPLKLEKKSIRQEECLVCIIHRPGEREEYLLEQRPATGLLASMWQFPCLTLSTTHAATTDEKKHVFPCTPLPNLIDTFINSLLDANTKGKWEKNKVASITHTLSHLNLTMHVHKISLAPPADKIEINGNAEKKQSKKRKQNQTDKDVRDTSKKNNFGSKLGDKALSRWASAEQVEAESMGTGMRNCWLALQTQQSSGLSKRAKSTGKKSKR
ncbi:hypothetical protein NDA14_003334 [Ustilago hordei]|uniref:Adenine DNA glycosylase n=1 Tax=Ustilago hordei TaxID=120017 RepID=I2FPU5_USTHO|nr:uncharacterized protein UHO2_04749 [Ustilago hordei]KAJ1041801.1 hypothetical protein NDA10_006668 [Ustilago hordei]KAJ1597012.1 hypothetical protein NDA14_003334 [Ustilago hordei]UTT89572.1 hypothetical protein NDA17_004830 [Ustilago hordei]CCF48938.1 related to A/G-specific adenine DNA glycosylase [Ustilago hordei]SYW76508.1 related to A/G-specific adenine DNA glycosylase [Ustilago hordei]